MPRLIQIQSILMLVVITFAERLPDNVVPQEYKLEIITNLGDEEDSFNFKGSVLIHIKCISSTDRIILHSKYHKVDEAKTVLRNLNQTEDSAAISGTSQDADNDFLILTLSQALQADLHYELELHFQGDLGDEQVGYYRSLYFDEEGEEKWIGVTYFKPDNARRAFPCFDELTFKAKFTISLGRSTKFTSLSNMPLLETEEMENKPNWEWDRFETTPPISTYNVGYFIINFNSSNLPESELLKNLTFWGIEGVIGVPGHNIMKWSAIFFDQLETYFDMKYPLPKVDIVAIPEYPAQVRECWGLIVWQEEYMLELSASYGANPQNVFANSEQVIRQWFEDLVTIKSWTNMWFVMGLGTYLSEILINQASLSQVGISSNLATDSIISVVNSDSLQSARAISVPEDQSESVTASEDQDTNKKAYLLMRMLSYIVGRDNLQRAMHLYLKKYEYRNAGSDELLEILNNKHVSPDVDLKKVMDTWFLQAGVPLITVTRDYQRGTLEVKQERFFKDAELIGTDTTKWWVPLTFTSECELDFNKTSPIKWLSPNEDSVTIESPMSPADWVIFNTGAFGLYLVNYDEENWNLIIDFLNKPNCKRIPPLNRVLLIDNAARLAYIGRLKYEIFLDMLKYLEQEKNANLKYPVFPAITFDPTYTALRALDDLSTLLKRTPIHGKFENYVKRILKGMFLKDERFALKSRKEDMQSSSNPQRTSVKDIGFATFLLKQTILCIDDAAKEYSWSQYMQYKDMENDKLVILWTLNCCKNETLLRDYLQNSLHEKLVEGEDVALVITAIAANKIGYELLVPFLDENIKVIHDRISSKFRELGLAIVEIARHIVNENELKWLQNFIDTNREYLREVQANMDEALEIAKLQVQWHQSHYKTIAMYFDKNYDDQ